jgi:hypothetical protein
MVTVTLRGGHLRWPLLSLEDLNIDSLVLQRFSQGIIDTIPKQYIGKQFVHVVPNLTKGNIVSVTKSMLKSTELTSWKEMKRYWKNMYGFRLSDSEQEEPLFFVNVTFAVKDPQVYSYPEWTVRGIEPFEVSRIDPRAIMNKFKQDMEGEDSITCTTTLLFIT